MQIKIIKKFTSSALKDFSALLSQWSASRYQISEHYFRLLVKNSHIVALYDKKNIVGTVTLIKLYKLSGVKGSIEHLIIDEKYRGRGLGKKLMKYTIGFSKKLKIESLFLTCEPERIAANSLYKKLGFKVKKTNFYYLHLKKK